MSIQLEYLCTLKTKHDIKNRLGQLPPKLIDIYDQLFRRRTKSCGPEHRRILDLALSSLLLPFRPDAKVFAQMLFANEGDESSNEDYSSSGNESSNEDNSSGGAEISDEDDRSGGSDAKRSASEPVKRARAFQGPEAVTELCFSLVVFDSTSGVFRFAHTSVQDYLLQHENGYYASENRNSARVAEHCISLLLGLPDQIHEKDQMFLQPEPQQEQTDCKTQSEDGGATDVSFWYVQPSSASNRTRLENMLVWVQYEWGFFVRSSREYREKLPLTELEVRLQQKLDLQPWESVNPRIFFSACRYGLGSFVDTWTKAHAHLINVRLLPAADKINKHLLGTGLQYACIGGDSGIVERLIDEGAVIDYYSQGTPRTNALCIALQHRNTTITKLLLDRGSSPSLALDAGVRFPLHLIIWNGHEDALSLVQMLLEHGADADLVDDYGMTAIVIAVEKENLEIVHLLLQEHAKIPLRLSIDDGRTNILVLATIIRTTPVKSLKMVQLMLEHGVDVDFRTARGETPLWCAAENGNPDVARLLLDHGAAVDVQDVHGKTPLIAALRKLRSVTGTRVQISKPPEKLSGSTSQVQKCEDIARLLVSYGANTDLRTISGNVALHLAAAKGSREMVELLLNHSANPNSSDDDGWTALLIAVSKGYKDIVELLLSHNANPNVTNDNRVTPLLNAAKKGYKEIVELLLTYNANLHARDKGGWTALHRAAENGLTEMVELLLSHGANPNITNDYRSTPLLDAAEKGYKEIVELLLTYNANLHARDKGGWTALHSAAENGHERTTKLLLAYNADVKALNLFGSTALLRAATQGYTDIVTLLVDAGSELSAADGGGYTAMHEAAGEGHNKTVESLLTLGADPNILTLHGNNALSNAASQSKPEVCELLLPTTTDINSQDGDGDTALSNAVDNSQPPYMIELLLEAGAQIIPQQPGPHCSFLDHTERIKGYGNDALLMAWNEKKLDLLQTILSFAARRDPNGEYATALVLWEKKKEEYAAWMEARHANAPENRPEVVAFRKKIKQREDEIEEQCMRQLAMELGLAFPAEE